MIQSDMEATKPQAMPIGRQAPSPINLFLKAISITLGFVFLFIFLTLTIFGFYAYGKFNTFAQVSGTSYSELKTAFDQGWSQTPMVTDGHKNILILGVDSLEMRGDVPPLTDTMILASIDTTTGKINMLSLPRDLWSADYQTKINALLAYGYERDESQPTAFPTQVLSEMTGTPIHHTVVLSMDQVAEVIDLLGGIDVDVQQGFTDTEFPRSDVDIYTETDPEKLYETVSFEAGKQTMDGQTALKFIRSRHSGDEEGTDDARAFRQQQVILAVISKLKQRNVLTDPVKLGNLFAFYKTNYESVISLPELIATAKVLYPHRNSIEFVTHSLSVYPDDEEGVIYHPEPSYKYQNQWVYEVVDFGQFTKEINRLLDIGAD